MGRKYRFHDQQSLYFVTFTVVEWIDVFTRNEYRLIFIDSLQYCIHHKGLQLYAWVIMTNHVHLIISTDGSHSLSDIVRDLKSFTSRHIRKAIEDENNHWESRRSWMLRTFKREGIYNSNNIDFQFWQQHNHPIELNTREKLQQRLTYLHNNPVKAGFVKEPHYWDWSSAVDYSGGKGMLEIIFIEV